MTSGMGGPGIAKAIVHYTTSNAQVPHASPQGAANFKHFAHPAGPPWPRDVLDITIGFPTKRLSFCTHSELERQILSLKAKMQSK
eukprot:2739234-Heterocapsa_arctica.AAC.1